MYAFARTVGIALLVGLLAQDSHAQEEAVSPSDARGELNGWRSAARFGFAVEDRSSTGFGKASGSVMLFDAERSVASRVAVGLRSFAAGASQEGRSFYRLSVGPLTSLRITETVTVQGAIFRFQETSERVNGGGAQYQSSGYGGMIGWNRSWRLGSNARMGLGGFASWHGGEIAMVASAGQGAAPRRNVGSSRGLEVSLLMDL